MNQEEIIKGNKLIAEFMDIIPIKGISKHSGKEYYYYNNTEMKDYEALPNYNIEWNNLIPVIEKIENLYDLKKDGYWNHITISNSQNCGVDYTDDDYDWNKWDNEIPTPKIYNKYYYCDISTVGNHSRNLSNIASFQSQNKLEAIYNTVISYIKYYNKNA